MKSFWALAAKLLFVIVLVQAWFLYDMHKKNTALVVLNDEYSSYLQDSEQKIAELELALEETEKKTVNGIIKETNKAVVSGWESLLNKVEQELERAKKAVPDLLNEIENDLTEQKTPLTDPSIGSLTPEDSVEGSTSPSTDSPQKLEQEQSPSEEAIPEKINPNEGLPGIQGEVT